MSKFMIQYELEAIDLTDATNVAHEILYVSNIDAESVKVTPIAPPGSSDRTFADLPTETNPRLAQRLLGSDNA